MEPRRDGPGRPFDQYYSQTPTHLWLHDLETGELKEICDKDRLAPFETPALLVGEDRLLIQVVRKNVGQIFSVRLERSRSWRRAMARRALARCVQLGPPGASGTVRAAAAGSPRALEHRTR